MKVPTGLENIQNSTVVELAGEDELIASMEKEAVNLKKSYPKSQKEASINELNDIIMQSPEEAAKLITSYLKD